MSGEQAEERAVTEAREVPDPTRCACCGSGVIEQVFPCGWGYCWHCLNNRYRHDGCEDCLALAVQAKTAQAECSRLASRVEELEQTLADLGKIEYKRKKAAENAVGAHAEEKE